jgi:hypothetical protein
MRPATPAAKAVQTIKERPAEDEKLSPSEARAGRKVRHSDE